MTYRSKRSKNGKLQTFKVDAPLPELPKTETGYPRYIKHTVKNEKTGEYEEKAFLVNNEDDIRRVLELEYEKKIGKTGVGPGARSQEISRGFETPKLVSDALIEAYDRLSELQTPEHVARWLSKQLNRTVTVDEMVRMLVVSPSQLDEWKVNRDAYAQEVAEDRGAMPDEEREDVRVKDRQRKLEKLLNEKLASGEISEVDYPKYVSGELKLKHGGSRAGAGRKKQSEKLPSQEFFEDQPSEVGVSGN